MKIINKIRRFFYSLLYAKEWVNVLLGNEEDENLKYNGLAWSE